MLSTDELERYHRFVFEKDRHLFLVSHALVRKVLSKYADVQPAQWGFKCNRFGKPYIASPEDAPHLQFNLAHTKRLAVCAVSSGQEVGIDAEALDRGHSGLGIARNFFAASEVACLENMKDPDQSMTFLRFWTLKEAYIKARGVGLSAPLKDFGFDLSADENPKIEFYADMDDSPEPWHFAHFRPTSEHLVALAIKQISGPQVSVCLREYANFPSS